MKLWTKIKRLFRKSKPTLCWIDHFSGVKAICWVRIAEDMAVKAVFPAESLRHLMAGDAFYYDLETKQFSDAGKGESRLIKMELEKLDAEYDESIKQNAIMRAFETGNIVMGNKNENGEWNIKEIPNG